MASCLTGHGASKKSRRARAVTVNTEAQALLAVLNLEPGLTVAQAEAQGYHSLRWWADSCGIGYDLFCRKVKDAGSKFESVKVLLAGGPRYYRLKKR